MTIDLKAFVGTYVEVHTSGGCVTDVATQTGMTPQGVSQLSGKLRKLGVKLPPFKKGRRSMVLDTSLVAELNGLL